MIEDKVELDLELDAELQADLNTTPVELESAQSLFEEEEKEEHHYEFEGIPRPSVLFLRGVDDLSTSDITSYVGSPLLQKVQWINDASCNLVFESNAQAVEVAQSLLKEPTDSLDHLTLLPAKPFAKEDRTIDLFVRIATDEDVKERGSREKSRYYQLHGVENETPREANQRKGRMARAERMTRNGGDGRDVFSRLGNRIPARTRSQSPSRETTRTLGRDRSIEREVPRHLKDRLGPRRES
ncbi:hypothetical protein A0J61_00600 [Choanephora cucurbitarum]|uniref:Uncharacterized protein n=1 Tax=Choanephora cucurbitarum TaxID=101091 RepID=A0A1C7NQM3_9FUNG|nr:hypothetical protein A0J61_00600 [Choanephora cucurbitarum]